ncbi:MAG: GNAT family N-acetyltransferase [Anaerolineales bacterium]|nr:MAG: GNAT family N-acetyltransferase [Anaerolineales bacterium]
MLITIRPVEPADYAAFLIHQADEVSRHMAAFGPIEALDEDAHAARWERLLANPDGIARTILADGEVVGNIMKFVMFDENELAYWIGREHWGRGIATQALRLFLHEYRERPLGARAVKDNIGSVRVLEKCGFRLVGEERAFSDIRKADVDEVIMRLEQ